MKTPIVLTPGAQVAVAAIVVLGMLGGSLILAYSGFGTSPRRGGPSTFVPVPQAYVLVATMYGMSVIGLLALLHHIRAARLVTALALLGYAGVATLLTAVLTPG